MRSVSLQLLFIFLIVASLFGCAQSSKTPADTLVVAIESMPATLDPRFATDAHSQWITSLIFHALVGINRNLEPEAEAAERIEMPDSKTYIFHLRPDLKFHNGRPLTAEDVEWSVHNIVDPNVKSPFAGAFKKIKLIKILEKGTIKMELDQPFAPFLVDLTLLKILPKEAGSPANPEFAKMPMGSGSFRALNITNDRIDLQREPKIAGGVDKIRFLLVQDMNTRFLKLKQGEVDFVQNAIDKQILISEVKKNKNLTMLSEPGIIYQYLVFNLRDSILSKHDVREAMAYAINKEEIIDHLLAGFAASATSLLAPSNAFFQKDLPAYGYNPEKAKKLLDKAGYLDPDGDGPGMRFVIDYKTSSVQESMDVAQIVRDQLRAVGVDVNVKATEWGTFYGDLKSGNFQIASGRLVGITDPDIYYDLFHSSNLPPEGRNRGFYVDKEIDLLTSEGRVTSDFAARKAIYSKVQKKIAHDLPYLSLWYNNNVAVFRNEIRGFKMYPNASFLSLIDTKKQKGK